MKIIIFQEIRQLVDFFSNSINNIRKSLKNTHKSNSKINVIYNTENFELKLYFLEDLLNNLFKKIIFE